MSENEYSSILSRYGSIDPSSICVGPRAMRNGDGSVNITRPTSTQRPRPYSPANLEVHLPVNTGITLNDVPKGKLKQPHNTLPLKMILSEVARRGEESFSATLPNDYQHPSTVSSVDDLLFARPPKVDNKKNRLDLLNQPKYMSKKRFQRNVKSGRGIQEREHYYKKSDRNNASDQLYKCMYEEDPLTPGNCVSSRFRSDFTGKAFTGKPNSIPFPSTTFSNLKYNSSVASSVSSTSQPESNNLSIGECTSYSNNFSTPFAMSRFQNLYGNSINNQKSNICQSISDKPEQSKTSLATKKGPLCHLQNRCNYNTIDNCLSSNDKEFPAGQCFVDHIQRIDKVADARHQHKEIEFLDRNKQNTSETTLRSQSFLTGENVPKKLIGNKRENEDSSNKFIWEPQYQVQVPECSKKVKRPLYVQNNYNPEEGQKENLHYCSSNYSYEFVEYDVTMSSQSDTAYELQASKNKTNDFDCESILSNGSFESTSSLDLI